MLVLLNVIQGIGNSIFELTDSNSVKVILYERKFLNISSKTNVLNATIDFFLKPTCLTKEYLKVKIN